MSEREPELLERILAQKHTDVAALRHRALPSPPARRAVSLRRAGRLHLIAEIKLRSPSAGALSRVLSVAERAAAYAECGADMVSVLCDRTFFDGAFEHLAEARAACELPLLCKDFVIDEVQLDLARAFGADAVLLIVRCLSEQRLRDLVVAARERGLEPFVEIASAAEAPVALDAGASLIGVNARDLNTLAMDTERARSVLADLPTSVTRVHLSGLSVASNVAAVAAGPADAALLGEALMRQDDPRKLLTLMVRAAHGDGVT
ncbi:MAG TPA: indole-3-glycerol phosphate synthase TrpC [Polyangiaceae bacterium]|jgi:indole-3-glycerol phosphate synthase